MYVTKILDRLQELLIASEPSGMYLLIVIDTVIVFFMIYIILNVI